MMIERERIALIEARDGKPMAIEWVRRTLSLYRKALTKPRHTFVRPIRLSLHQSVRDFKLYLRENV